MADAREQVLEQCRIVAGIVDDLGAERVDAARERHRVRADQVDPADLQRVAAEPGRDRIEQA